MNSIYKVIFNQATGTYQAVSELGRGRKKTKSVKFALVAASVMMAGTASADTYFHVNTGAADQPAGDATTNEGTVDAKGGATGQYAVAAGLNTTAKGNQAISVGYNSNATADSTVAIGSNTNALHSRDIAIGQDATAQSTAVGAISIGFKSTATAKENGRPSYSPIAIGANSEAKGTQTVAIGWIAKATDEYTTAVGGGATASGYNSSAFGNHAIATHRNAAAFGANAKALNQNATSIGNYSVARDTAATATGSFASATGQSSSAFGSGSNAAHSGSLALGAHSRTEEAVGTPQATVNDITYSGFAGANPSATVSVGTAWNKRTITNVAAGRITETSTDAINGSQLYLVTKGTLDQMPIIYTDKDGKKVVKYPDGNFYPADINISPSFKWDEDLQDFVPIYANQDGNEVRPVTNVITSMNDGDNVADTRRVLQNLTSNLKNNTPQGLLNLNNSTVKDSTAATVGDLRNMGWIVSAPGNSYTGTVKNANEVKFVGANGIEVDGKTIDNVREITVKGTLFETKTVEGGYKIIITQPNGKTQEMTVLNGKDGQDGKDGTSVIATAQDNGSIKVEKVDADGKTTPVGTLTQGPQGETGAQGPKGETGAAGRDGVDGRDGANAVASVTDNGDGTHTISITDGNGQTTITTVKDGANGSGATVQVEGGDNVTVDENTANGETTYTISATDSSASVSAGSTDVEVKPGATTKVGTTDVTDYAVDLSTGTKDNIKKGVDAYDTVTNQGLTFASDDGSTAVQKLGSTVNINGGDNIKTKADGNTITVSLKDDITVEKITAREQLTVGTGSNQVVLNDRGVNVGGNTYISNSGINANNQNISNVADATQDHHAVNLRQLNGMAQNIYGDIDHLHNRIGDVDRAAKAGIASAMAFEEAPFVPGKWTYAAGAAHYSGEQAVAVTLKKTADNGRWAFTGGMSRATEGGTGVRIGVSGVID